MWSFGHQVASPNCGFESGFLSDPSTIGPEMGQVRGQQGFNRAADSPKKNAGMHAGGQIRDIFGGKVDADPNRTGPGQGLSHT